jgi:tRNA-5-taurinomethyluridine 2-sulfurtransferase
MKIAVLTSGGVDSSVALRLLKDQGHAVTAFYLKIWLEDELAYLGECPWEEDLGYVHKICDEAKIPLEVISMQKEYWDRVVSYTIAECKAGRTPNPDILCNQQIKFGQFYTKIDRSFEKVATGHYAQVEEREGLFHLMRSPDPIKDQTYFLAYLNQSQLGRALFPIGQYHKSEVRTLAQRFNLPNQARKDSQGICFLGKIPYREFIREHLGAHPGDFIDLSNGKKVGEHEGYWFYTIGQRFGLKLSGGPWFVVGKDIPKNIIYLANGAQPKEVMGDRFTVGNMNWIIPNVQSPMSNPQCMVKIRHGAAMHDCTIESDGPQIHVRLSELIHGIAPGQFAVFYDGEECLGGGVIVDKLSK